MSKFVDLRNALFKQTLPYICLCFHHTNKYKTHFIIKSLVDPVYCRLSEIPSSGIYRLKYREMLFSFKNKYYTYPNTYIALYFSYAKVTYNTHKNKKSLSIPLKLVPSLAKLPLPYFPPSTGRSASSHPNESFQTVHIYSGAGGRETYMCSVKV